MEEEKSKQVFIDAEYNFLKAIPNPKVRLREFFNYQIQKYKGSINEEKMNRYLKNLSSSLLDPEEAGPFLKFYFEARDLYREGFFYSCIAMCRITAEKICKALVDVVNIPIKDKKRLLDLRFYNLIWVMSKLNIVDSEIFDHLDNIRRIGNNYIHSKGTLNSPLDSENVINSLGRLIDRTSSIFNKYDIVQGKLVPKSKKRQK